MGSGARAYRAAMGQEQAMDEAYLRQLQAEAEGQDFSDIFDLQASQIMDLSEQLASTDNRTVAYPVTMTQVLPERRNWIIYIVIAAIVAAWYFFKNKL